MNGKKYSGLTEDEMANAIGNYFLPDSREYETVISGWCDWINWKPGKRRAIKADDGSRIPQEQPEYRNRFTIRTDNETGEIIFKKTIIFKGKLKKIWDERIYGILRNTTRYQLTI